MWTQEKNNEIDGVLECGASLVVSLAVGIGAGIHAATRVQPAYTQFSSEEEHFIRNLEGSVFHFG